MFYFLYLGECMVDSLKENGKKISVVIPTKNEEDNICKIIQKVKKAKPYEIIVVDGFSKDKTKKLAQEELVTVVDTESKSACPGKGDAMRTGVEHATGDIIFFLDSDIRNFKKEWFTKMTDPIIKGETDICKAEYIRLPKDAPVTKLVAKPLLKMYFPGLQVSMPLEGEIAARKSTFSKLIFVCDWGVDVGLILSAYKQGFKIKNVFLGKKKHKKSYVNDIAELNGMATEVMRTILEFKDNKY